MAEVEGAMQTPDGAWRVEVVRRKRTRWYRIVHDDDVIDWLSIAAVERVLAEAGVDRCLLAEVDPATQPQVAAPEFLKPAHLRSMERVNEPRGCRPAAPPS